MHFERHTILFFLQQDDSQRWFLLAKNFGYLDMVYSVSLKKIEETWKMKTKEVGGLKKLWAIDHPPQNPHLNIMETTWNLLNKNKKKAAIIQRRALNFLQKTWKITPEDYLMKWQEGCLKEFMLYWRMKLGIPNIDFKDLIELWKLFLSHVLYFHLCLHVSLHLSPIVGAKYKELGDSLRF